MAEFFRDQTANETALEGCPDPTAGRAIVIPGGFETTVCHQFRNSDGEPVDLIQYIDEGTDPAGTGCGCGPPVEPEPDPDPPVDPPVDPPEEPCTHYVQFADAVCGNGNVHKSPAYISCDDPTKLCFTVPPDVYTNPRIYTAEMVVVDGDCKPIAMDTTLISVERSLQSRTIGLQQRNSGPLTINEIRTHLRDFPVLNSYWDGVEFSDAEILHAIIEPVRKFNETIPRVISFTPANFPFRHNWLEATCAVLLRISAASYLRNSRRLAYGDGKTSDDKDKHTPYANLAEHKWRIYTDFCVHSQVAANLSYGSVRTGGWVQG